jgi:regulatory protein YycH of two-component signal transduction system YycFG
MTSRRYIGKILNLIMLSFFNALVFEFKNSSDWVAVIYAISDERQHYIRYSANSKTYNLNKSTPYEVKLIDSLVKKYNSQGVDDLLDNMSDDLKTIPEENKW